MKVENIMTIFYLTIIGLKIYSENESPSQFFISLTKALTENRITKISKREYIRGNTTRLNKQVIPFYRVKLVEVLRRGVGAHAKITRGRQRKAPIMMRGKFSAGRLATLLIGNINLLNRTSL